MECSIQRCGGLLHINPPCGADHWSIMDYDAIGNDGATGIHSKLAFFAIAGGGVFSKSRIIVFTHSPHEIGGICRQATHSACHWCRARGRYRDISRALRIDARVPEYGVCKRGCTIINSPGSVCVSSATICRIPSAGERRVGTCHIIVCNCALVVAIQISD